MPFSKKSLVVVIIESNKWVLAAISRSVDLFGPRQLGDSHDQYIACTFISYLEGINFQMAF